jgi:hypothetical protein
MFQPCFPVFWAWWSPIWRIWWSGGCWGWSQLAESPDAPCAAQQRAVDFCMMGTTRKGDRWCWYIYIDMLILYSIYNMIYIHTNYSICWFRWWYMYSIWCIHNPYRWMMIDDGISIAGWWFQTWILFPIIYGIILPIDFHIFQDG